MRNFDDDAATWDEKPARRKLAAGVAEAIRQNVPLESLHHILDFGCGTGLLAFALAGHAKTVTGIDTSQGMLDVMREKAARQGITNVHTLWIDPHDGQWTGEYDLVVSNMTLHHVEHILPLLCRFCACLHPGGYLCIADLDSDDGQFHTDKTGVFHSGFHRTELRSLLQKAGFGSTTDTTAAEVVRPGADGQVRCFTVFLITGRRI